MSLRTKPFKKNQYGYPTHELDGKVGYPVDHSHNDGKGGAKPHGTNPMSNVSHKPGKPGAGSDPDGPGDPAY